MASEATIVRSILQFLRSQEGVWAFKVHGGPMQVAGIPDIVGVAAGRFFGLEVKRPGEKATVLQEAMLRKIQAAGGLAAVVTSVAEVRWLLPATPPHPPAGAREKEPR